MCTQPLAHEQPRWPSAVFRLLRPPWQSWWEWRFLTGRPDFSRHVYFRNMYRHASSKYGFQMFHFNIKEIWHLHSKLRIIYNVIPNFTCKGKPTPHQEQLQKLTFAEPESRLPCWSFPVRPCLFAKHLVSFQAGFIGLPEGVACPPHSDILQQTQVPDLMAHETLVENVCCFFIIRLDAPKTFQAF